jgi:hypothetical protein
MKSKRCSTTTASGGRSETPPGGRRFSAASMTTVVRAVVCPHLLTPTFATHAVCLARLSES